jgi:hypothetical protein
MRACFLPRSLTVPSPAYSLQVWAIRVLPQLLMHNHLPVPTKVSAMQGLHGCMAQEGGTQELGPCSSTALLGLDPSSLLVRFGIGGLLTVVLYHPECNQSKRGMDINSEWCYQYAWQLMLTTQAKRPAQQANLS